MSAKEIYSKLVGLPGYSFEETEKAHDFDSKFDQVFYHKNFIENKLATFVSRLSDENNDPFLGVDDYQVSLLLAMVSDVDFRGVFTKKYSIINKSNQSVTKPEELSNSGFEVLYRNSKEREIKYNPEQEGTFAEGFYSGLFTTFGFGSRFYSGGTNRRPIKAIYDIFLCSPTEVYKDPGLSIHYIAPDIDRMPGAKPEAFFQRCSSCHAPYDSQRGYAAKLDYRNDQTVLLDTVSEKYNRNDKGFGGYITTDDSWENPLTSSYYQEIFGWRTPTNGYGVNSFADMIVSSEKFSECMAQKITKEICPGNISFENEKIKTELHRVARDFESKSYVFKELVKSVFRSPLLCSK